LDHHEQHAIDGTAACLALPCPHYFKQATKGIL
jgi:hypothetical protein